MRTSSKLLVLWSRNHLVLCYFSIICWKSAYFLRPPGGERRSEIEFVCVGDEDVETYMSFVFDSSRVRGPIVLELVGFIIQCYPTNIIQDMKTSGHIYCSVHEWFGLYFFVKDYMIKERSPVYVVPRSPIRSTTKRAAWGSLQRYKSSSIQCFLEPPRPYRNSDRCAFDEMSVDVTVEARPLMVSEVRTSSMERTCLMRPPPRITAFRLTSSAWAKCIIYYVIITSDFDWNSTMASII